MNLPVDQLIAAARAASHQAYAPYSQFQVGAAVLTATGNIYQGCNLENSSYGLCMCAERNGIAAARAAEGSQTQIKAVAVVNAQNTACPPCGACRQVILELGAEAIVIFQDQQGWQQIPIEALLPYSFQLTSNSLLEDKKNKFLP